MDPQGPAWPGREDPMDDDRPLFSTFKPISENNTASTKPAPVLTPVQPQGHHDTHGRVPRGSGAALPGWSLPEGDPRPELVALRAQTRLWFEQTQARRLGAKGELPTWFHGFISRRETEQLLQDQPSGCFLVRFSESTVGFVLSYRGRERCRHFVLDQWPDGRYVILGEQSAHTELTDLLRHYAAAPIMPYHEFLTVPCRRAASIPPPLPAKASSLAAAQGPHSPSGSGAAPEGPYTQVHKEAVLPEPPAQPQSADPKYQQLMCFHVYAEPHEGIAPSPSAYYEVEEPIPFYATGRGSSPSSEENVYSEVAVARQDLPAPLPGGIRGAFSTLPPKPRAHRQLFRSASSQASKKRQLPAAPTAVRKERGGSGPAAEVPQGTTTNPRLEFDNPVGSRRTSGTKRATTAAGQESPENIYEQLSGDRL
ncbi:SH2 domain-containing protein 2A [Grus japonensis]|uniref:SH2 domain-containing protein 2A n=1 Tax=Grus japonensis TaxID=30415 RepID=A0ABC9XUH2_GRUJA